MIYDVYFNSINLIQVGGDSISSLWYNIDKMVYKKNQQRSKKANAQIFNEALKYWIWYGFYFNDPPPFLMDAINHCLCVSKNREE